MMDVFTPAQQSSDAVARIVAQNSEDQRAERLMRLQEQQNIAKNFESFAHLAQSVKSTDKNLALQFMNRGLQGFGVSLTMEQFDPAMQGFETVAGLMRDNDHQGAVNVLQAMHDSGMVTNLRDMQRAEELRQQAHSSLGQEHAETVMQMQYPEEHASQQRVNAYRAFQRGEVDQEHISQLYGTPDPTEQLHQFARDEAKVQAFEAQSGMRATLARAFSQAPGLGRKAIESSVSEFIGAKPRALVRIGQLMDKPELTEQEELELQSLGGRYGTEHLQRSLDIQTAARQAKQLTLDLNETKARSTAVRGLLDTLQVADTSIAERAATRAQTKPLKGTLPASEADQVHQQHALQDKWIAEEEQVFNGQTAGARQQAEQEAGQQRIVADQLAKEIVYANPDKKEALQRRKKEALRAADSNEAMARLLGEENPYLIAQMEADVVKKTDGKERDRALDRLNKLRSSRAKDLMIVQAEQERLQDRHVQLTAQLGKAEKEADEDQRITEAVAVIDKARGRGISTTTAMRDASREFRVPESKLFKVFQQHLSLGLVDAQNEYAALPAGQQTPQGAARIGKKYGVSAKDVMEGIKDPNKPLVQVDTGTKASEEAAKQFTQATRQTYEQLKHAPVALQSIEMAKALIPQAKGFMGPGGEALLEAAKFLNNRLGATINTEGVKSAEELRTRIFFNIMDNLKKMDAQPSQLQQQIMMESLGKLGTDPNALVNVLDAFGDVIRGKVEQFNHEVSGAEKRGTRFPYDPRITLPPKRGAGGEVMIASDADYNALPPGTVFIGPDGKKRKKP